MNIKNDIVKLVFKIIRRKKHIYLKTKIIHKKSILMS